MLKVGITGGIGSGKTTVCKIFELMGIPVYYADERAKWLMNNDPQLIDNLKENFGSEVYNDKGQLNRAYLANIVFHDQSRLEILNGIVHPAVYQDGVSWHNHQKDVPFTLKEAALFFENGTYKKMDKMITVSAPEALRIQRVIKRDQTNEKAVKARINKQLPDAEKINKSDFVIYNDGNQSLILQAITIFQALKS